MSSATTQGAQAQAQAQAHTQAQAPSDADQSGGGGAPLSLGALEVAKSVLQERALSVVLTPNATHRSLEMLGRFFGWQRRTPRPASSRGKGVGSAVGGGLWTEAEPNPSRAADVEAEAASPPLPAAAAPLLRERLGLDARIYELAVRLADEQHRSVVWEEEEEAATAATAGGTGADMCLAAEEAGEKAAARRVPPTPLVLGATASFTWDGDGYRVYELSLPPRSPARSVTLLLRGKSVIGSSTFSVNIFISHKTPQPSFAERTFRYVFESHPPHRRASKFVLGAERLKTACAEAAAAATNGTEGAAECRRTRPLTLWIAFKCRSVAVSQLTLVATQGRASLPPRQKGLREDRGRERH